MLVDFRLELHLRGDGGVHAGEFACDQARAVERCQRFLAADAQPTGAFRHVGEGGRHLPRRIIPVADRAAVEVVVPGNLRHRRIRQIRLFDFEFGQIGAVRHAQPAVIRPCHLLNGGFTAKRTT